MVVVQILYSSLHCLVEQEGQKSDQSSSEDLGGLHTSGTTEDVSWVALIASVVSSKVETVVIRVRGTSGSSRVDGITSLALGTGSVATSVVTVGDGDVSGTGLVVVGGVRGLFSLVASEAVSSGGGSGGLFEGHPVTLVDLSTTSWDGLGAGSSVWGSNSLVDNQEFASVTNGGRPGPGGSGSLGDVELSAGNLSAGSQSSGTCVVGKRSWVLA